ncbi:MAG: peroxide stress protein YaaA, partial [Erysipelotrichaceae bacterium]
MKVILAPAKNMQLVSDSSYDLSKPVFINEAELLLNKLKKLNYDELKEVYGASDRIVKENMERLTYSFLDR